MSIKIVIADDHQLFIDGIKSILSKVIGIAIVGEAKNGLELIKFLDQPIKPDIILTDIRMPVIDGITATRILSKDYPDIPILALSMYDQEADVIEMLEAGAKGYVTKNVEKDELVTAIQRLDNGAYYFSKNLPNNIQERFNKGYALKHQILTRRENEILELIAKGRSTKQIAQQLKVSKFTVDTHRKNIHKKLGIKSNTGLVNYVLKKIDSTG